jgi:hypothetical protein
MECHSVDITSRCGEPHYLSIYSDIHDAAERALPHMRRRAELPNSHFICLGDLFDMIVPSDNRRFQPSRVRETLQGTDDFIDKAIDEALQMYGSFPWIMMGNGNHCNEVLRRHYTNPMARLASKLRVPFGGFSGYLRVRIRTGKGTVRWNLVILYHHGGSSGPVTKGLPWAQRFCSGFADWDIFAYAHNHQCHVHQEAYLHLAEKHDKLIKRNRYIVNTGTFLDGYEQGESPSYVEVKGYKPVAIAAPLIKLVPTREGNHVNISISVGDE